jgi:hypothetical protein
MDGAGISAPEARGRLGIAELRAFLLGPWRLTRVMADRRAGQTGRLDGEAVFSPEAEGLVYRERGVLRLGAYEGAVTRRYRYAFPAPGWAEVAFEDGRPFYTLDLSDGRCTVQHRCRDDLYRGAFEVEGQDLWTVVWRVWGPGKDQLLTSRYARRA